MSNCNFTSVIYEQENIGDSLVKINNNFSSLDDATCELKANFSTLSSNITAFITDTVSNSSTNWNATYNVVSQLSSTWDQTTTINTILTSYVPLSGNSTIYGDLNVQNHILSGTVNLLDIFVTTETDNQTLSYSITGGLSISNGNTVTLSAFDNINVATKLLSANTDLSNIFLTPNNTLTTSICAMSGNGSVPFVMQFTNGLLTGITF